MLTHLWVEGKIECTLLRLDNRERGETQSTPFHKGNDIPSLRFSRGEKINFSVVVKEIGEEVDFPYKTTKWRREGELSFHVFLSDAQRSAYSGGKSFSLHLIEREQSFEWENIAIIKGMEGRVGTIAVKLFLKILT